MPCFFHFSQCLWRKANEIGLRSKVHLDHAKEMILNLKSLAFNDLEEIDERFYLIEEEYQKLGPEYEKLLVYFKKNCIKGNKYEKTMWNYSKGVKLDRIYQINFIIFYLKGYEEFQKF